MLGVLSGLNLHGCLARCHSCCKFTCASASLYLESSILEVTHHLPASRKALRNVLVSGHSRESLGLSLSRCCRFVAHNSVSFRFRLRERDFAFAFDSLGVSLLLRPMLYTQKGENILEKRRKESQKPVVTEEKNDSEQQTRG